MVHVSEKLMDDVWQRVAAMRVDQITAMQKRHQKEQKALTKFAYRNLARLREDAAGLGIYTFHVVLEAFSSITPRPREVRRPVIDRAWNRPADELAQDARSAEPHAAQYLDDALRECDDVVLTEGEREACVQVVHTAIVSLHGACVNRT